MSWIIKCQSTEQVPFLWANKEKSSKNGSDKIFIQKLYFRLQLGSLFILLNVISIIKNYLLVFTHTSSRIMTSCKMYNLLTMQSALFVTAICASLYSSNAYGYPNLNDSSLTVERYATGLSHPTTMAFLGADDLLVLEKDNGMIVRIKNGEFFPVFDVEVANDKELGMLGIDAVKRFSNSTMGVYDIFLRYTESFEQKNGNVSTDISNELNGSISNRLYKCIFIDDLVRGPGHETLNGEKILLDLPINELSHRHVGGIVAVNPKNTHQVYTIIGDLDSPNRTKVQNVHAGLEPDGSAGILGVTTDGRVIKNYTGGAGSTHSIDKYYAYGIRNSFGLTFDNITGRMWDTENGPNSDDELNLVDPGFNSGWQKIMGKAPVGFNASKELVTFGEKGRYSDPEFVWKHVVAPTALAFLNSDRLGSKYQNDLFVSSSMNGKIYRFELNPSRNDLLLFGALSDKVADTENETTSNVFGENFNGITDLKVGPDGYLYVVSISDGAIYRIVNRQN
jgi:aldose sugar dehydrogenase